MGHLIPTCYGSEQQISVQAIVHMTYYCVLTNPHPPLPPRRRRSQPFPAFFQTTLIAAISCTAYKRIFASAVCWWFRSCHCLRAGVERKSGGGKEGRRDTMKHILRGKILRKEREKKEKDLGLDFQNYLINRNYFFCNFLLFLAGNSLSDNVFTSISRHILFVSSSPPSPSSTYLCVLLKITCLCFLNIWWNSYNLIKLQVRYCH